LKLFKNEGFFFSFLDVDQLTNAEIKTEEEKAFSDWAVGLFALLNALRSFFLFKEVRNETKKRK